MALPEGRNFMGLLWHKCHSVEDVLGVVEEFGIAVWITVAVVANCLDEFFFIRGDYHLNDWFLFHILFYQFGANVLTFWKVRKLFTNYLVSKSRI